MKTIYDPLFTNYKQPAPNYTLEAHSPINAPLSPYSREPMQLVNCGSPSEAYFKAWVHLKDRVVLPFKE